MIALAAALQIELLFLPPYSPNLNLIERLGKLVKKNCLLCRYYETFAAFQSAFVSCLAQTQAGHRDQLRSLLTLNFQTLQDP